MFSNTAAKVLEEFGGLLMKAKDSERADYTEIAVCMGISMMRAGAGDQYVRGFLEGALADLDKPSETFEKPVMQ